MPDNENDECRLSKKEMKDLPFAHSMFFHVKVSIKMKSTLKTSGTKTLDSWVFHTNRTSNEPFSFSPVLSFLLGCIFFFLLRGVYSDFVIPQPTMPLHNDYSHFKHSVYLLFIFFVCPIPKSCFSHTAPIPYPRLPMRSWSLPPVLFAYVFLSPVFFSKGWNFPVPPR